MSTSWEASTNAHPSFPRIRVAPCRSWSWQTVPASPNARRFTEYIDHAFEGPSLTGKTPKDRATIHMMQRRAESSLLDAVATYFHHATPGLGPDIEGYQNKEWGEKQKEKALSGMRYFDDLLGAQPYIAGGDFSMADITAFADFAKIDIPDDCRNLKAWREKVAARPSIAN